MAYLITNHDVLHIHAICGLITVLNFLYRFYYFFQHGSFVIENDKFNLFFLGVNTLLSLSSLVFHIPSKRIKKDKPTIWKTYRLHAIIFSMRPILSTLISLIEIDTKTKMFLKIGLVFTVLILADIVTWMGDPSDETIRSMPFPDYVSESTMKRIARFHSSAQFGATLQTLSMDPTINYSSILGVYEAAFTMTLVRKGKITSRSWHLWYAFVLNLVTVVHMTRTVIINSSFEQYTVFIGMLIAPRLRIQYRMNKYLTWIITIMIIYFTYEYVEHYINNVYFSSSMQVYVVYNIYRSIKVLLQI